LTGLTASSSVGTRTTHRTGPKISSVSSRRRAGTRTLDRVELEAFTPKSFTTRKAVIDELNATRKRGYAISDEDVTPGVASIGGLREPILGEGSPVLPLARDAAAEISRTLGHDQTTAG